MTAGRMTMLGLKQRPPAWNSTLIVHLSNDALPLTEPNASWLCPITPSIECAVDRGAGTVTAGHRWTVCKIDLRTEARCVLTPHEETIY